MTCAQCSNMPRTCPPRGFPCAIQFWMMVSAAHTRSDRFAFTHAMRSGCLNPSRSQGLSILASNLIRTERRAISSESVGLFPVAIQAHRIGARMIRD